MREQGMDDVAGRRVARGADASERRRMAEREEELPQLSWTDTLAMIIAAYQILMPVVLAMAGVLVLAYFLFRWIFT